MKIKFYGSSHGLPERDRFCTSVLIESGGNYYMVDTGAPIADMLIRDGLTPDVLKAIFLTHLHGDHTCGMLSYLNLASWYYTASDPEIFTPSIYLEEAVNAWLKVEFREVRSFRFTEISEGKIYSDGVIKVRAIMTRHHNNNHPDHIRHSYGFAVEEAATGKKVLFTGDLTVGMHDMPSVAFEEDFDVIVLEGAHTPLHECIDVLKKCKTDRFIVGHVFHQVVTDGSLCALREKITVPVTVAEDMMEVVC